jgi:hypothetical protein
MTGASGLNLSVAGLFANRNARRCSNQEAAEQLHRRSFDRGESELMFSSEEPDWLLTMPAGVRKVHEYWRQNLKPGDIGRFFTWPKSALEA